jgi:hypothetical protein
MTINSWGSTDPVEVSKGGTGLTTLTDNNVLIGKGTSPLEFLSLSKGDLLVGDGVTNPIALSPSADDCRNMLTADSAEASGLKYAVDGGDLIELTTLSDVVSHTTCLMDSSYTSYVINLINFRPALNSVQLTFQFTEAGGSLLTSSLYYSAGPASEAASNGVLSKTGVLSGTGETLETQIFINNPSDTATKPSLYYIGGKSLATASGLREQATNYYNSALAVESITISFSSGNISSGTVMMYGIP